MTSSRKHFGAVFAVLSAALVLRALAAGVTYYPVVDDSIQYINFQRTDSFLSLIKTEGLFASRPLAVLTDLFFVGPMNSHLMVPVLLISVLYGLSGALFWRLFRNCFGTGTVFAVIYALLPLNCEGVFWLSASTRIVFGLLFTAIAANIFDDYVNSGKWWRIPLFALTVLLSYGFYEQILALSFTLTVLQTAKHRKNKRAWVALAAPTMAAVYFVFTVMNASDGAVGARMQLALPVSRWYFDTFLPDITGQMAEVFLKGGAYTLVKGFMRGAVMTLWGVIYMLAGLAVGVCVYCVSKLDKTKAGRGGALGSVIWGVLLFAAPLSPYLIIANPSFTFRAAVPSLVGAALIADTAFRCILRRGGMRFTAGALTAVFLIAGASEVRDYAAVGKYDGHVAETLLSYSNELSGRVGILGMEAVPPMEQNFYCNGHIVSCAGADWALYGKVASVCDSLPSFYPVPLSCEGDSFYHGWNTETKRISGFDQIWLWNGINMSMTRLTVCPDGGEYDFAFFLPDGTYVGRVWEEDGYGYVSLER